MFTSSIGKKFLMALSGVVLFGFIVGHLAGNLQIFLGPEKINAYAYFLQHLGAGLWVVRLGLLMMLIIHVWTSIQLTLESRAARPIDYIQKDYIKASYASRTMMMSGLIIFSFVIYHLAHFTFGLAHPQYYNLVDAKGRHDVYSMMVLSFQNPLIAAAYIVPLFLLCLHLSHGLSSMFQSLGFNNECLRSVLARWGAWVAWVIFAGYAAIPLAVLAGWIPLLPGVLPK